MQRSGGGEGEGCHYMRCSGMNIRHFGVAGVQVAREVG